MEAKTQPKQQKNSFKATFPKQEQLGSVSFRKVGDNYFVESEGRSKGPYSPVQAMAVGLSEIRVLLFRGRDS